MSSSKRDILRRVGVFAGLSDDDCDAVLAVLKARRGAAGDTLFREGDRGDSLMIVLEGQLAAHVNTDGAMKEVSRIGPGEILGELAFVDAEPRSATVTAPTGAMVLEFTRDAMAKLRTSKPHVAASIHRNLLTDMAKRLRHLATSLSDGFTPLSHRLGEPTTGGRQLTAAQLARIPALVNYSEEDLGLLAHISVLRSFEKNEALMEEGKPGDACWFLLTGSVVVTRANQATPLATLGPGAILGQLALIDRSPRSATVKATSLSTALELRDDAFANLMKGHSPIALRFQEQVALAGVRQLRVATRRFADLSAARKAATLTTRAVTDWDDGSDGVSLELAIDPPHTHRR